MQCRVMAPGSAAGTPCVIGDRRRRMALGHPLWRVGKSGEHRGSLRWAVGGRRGQLAIDSQKQRPLGVCGMAHLPFLPFSAGPQHASRRFLCRCRTRFGASGRGRGSHRGYWGRAQLGTTRFHRVWFPVARIAFGCLRCPERRPAIPVYAANKISKPGSSVGALPARAAGR